MSKILIIHTVLPKALVALTEGGTVIGKVFNDDQKSHGTFLHTNIQRLLSDEKLDASDIDAVAVITGPGSYTGIRVGISAAKGLAYALNIPVVPISTLEALAATAIQATGKHGVFVPLLHARATEYFVGWYDADLCVMREDAVTELDALELPVSEKESYFYFGPGITESQIRNGMFSFLEITDISETALANLALKRLSEGHTVNAAELKPSYLKPAYTTIPRHL